jgi:hypothetical protein
MTDMSSSANEDIAVITCLEPTTKLVNTGARVHAWNRRCAVGVLIPTDGGRCRHAHLVVNTYTIAVEHCPVLHRRRLTTLRLRGEPRHQRLDQHPTTHPAPTAARDDRPLAT